MLAKEWGNMRGVTVASDIEIWKVVCLPFCKGRGQIGQYSKSAPRRPLVLAWTPMAWRTVLFHLVPLLEIYGGKGSWFLWVSHDGVHANLIGSWLWGISKFWSVWMKSGVGYFHSSTLKRVCKCLCCFLLSDTHLMVGTIATTVG